MSHQRCAGWLLSHTESQEFPAGGYVGFSEDVLQVFLEGVFADAERPCDFVVVAVLVDLFGNLEFAVCEVAGVFQAGEGLFEVVGLGQAVGNLVEDGV